MSSNKEAVIAVIGATGQQEGAVVRALQAGNQFTARALTHNPEWHRELADDVVDAVLSMEARRGISSRFMPIAVKDDSVRMSARERQR